MGRSVHMHEALVFVSIILSTMLWGILGALLVVPVLASLVVVFDYLRRRVFGHAAVPAHGTLCVTPASCPGSEKPAARSLKKTRKKKE